MNLTQSLEPMIISALTLMSATTPLIDVTIMPPAPIQWAVTHVLVILVLLVTDSIALMLMSVMIVHAMPPLLALTQLVHTAVPVTTDGPAMDSLVLITMNVKMVSNDWIKSVLKTLSVPILMVVSHVIVTLDILVMVLMSVSILMSALPVITTATMMPHAATLTVASLVPVTLVSLVMVSLVTMSMNATVTMNAMPMVPAQILMAVTHVPVTKVTMVTASSAWTITNVPMPRITAVHLTQLVPTRTVHTHVHVISVTETVPTMVSNVSTTTNVLKIPTTVTPMAVAPTPLVASLVHVTLDSPVTELLALTSTNVTTAHAT